jgi:alkanesulfonate monooxygenase
LTKVPIGRPIANCVVGTVAQITGFVMQLYDIGVSRFILAGYDPINYPAEFGRALIPSIRAGVAGREAATVRAAG